MKNESHSLEVTSEKQIYQAVIDFIVASENVEINGGDDVNKDVSINNPYASSLIQLNVMFSRQYQLSTNALMA